jgi:membrane-associated phospholipid phosphatase
MRSRLAPFFVAFVVSALIFAAARMEPYFAGDIPVARAVQAASPGTAWATFVTSTAGAPVKYGLMAVAVVLAWMLAGWKGAAIAIGVILVEQNLGEASKQIAARPRPSPDLVRVVGHPSGYSFPSTFTTFYAAIFVPLLLLAHRARRTPLSTAVMLLSAVMIVVGWAARVTLGAHWPSYVVLATTIVLAWTWAAIRVSRPRR